MILEISLTGSCQIFLDIFFSHAVITASLVFLTSVPACLKHVQAVGKIMPIM